VACFAFWEEFFNQKFQKKIKIKKKLLSHLDLDFNAREKNSFGIGSKFLFSFNIKSFLGCSQSIQHSKFEKKTT
jgi:hypothetical protein